MAATSLSQGRTAFDNGKYEEALASFTNALSASNSRDVNHILDLRVATYAKLERLDMARKDATLMIRRDKKDARGYLRWGQLERLTGNYDAALKWYGYALKNVAKDDPLFAIIEAQLRKAKRTAAETRVYHRPQDPLKTLPAELIEMVLAFLDYKTLVRSLRVSKLWRQILLRLKTIQETIDFGESRKQISHVMLKAALSRLSKQPKEIRALCLSNTALNFLKTRLEHWREFTTLQVLWVNGTCFGNLPFNRYELRQLDLTLKGKALAADRLLENCPALEVLQLSIQAATPRYQTPWSSSIAHRSLRKLVLDACVSQFAADAFSCFPSLTVLTLRGVGFQNGLDLSSSCLKSLLLRGCLLYGLLVLPITLEVFDADHLVLGPMSSRLVKFDRTSTCLRDLRLELSVETYEALCSFAVFRSLQKLRISCPFSDQEFSSLVLGYSPQLQFLELEGARITGLSIVDMLSAATCRLERLVLCDCERVPPDAIDWARQKGVGVEVRRKPSTSGRRLPQFP